VIPARRWRGLALAAVVAADLVVVLVVTLASPDVTLLAAPLLLAFTVRAAFAPEGWAPHLLVLTQVGGYAMAVTAPGTALDWAAAALTALAVLGTHLCLSLLAAWPRRAALPTATAQRTATAFAVLGSLAVLGGLVAALVQRTPDTWAAWLVPLAVAAVATLLWALRGSYLPRVGR
jgi:hypothetical protein